MALASTGICEKSEKKVVSFRVNGKPGELCEVGFRAYVINPNMTNRSFQMLQELLGVMRHNKLRRIGASTHTHKDGQRKEDEKEVQRSKEIKED